MPFESFTGRKRKEIPHTSEPQGTPSVLASPVSEDGILVVRVLSAARGPSGDWNQRGVKFNYVIHRS